MKQRYTIKQIAPGYWKLIHPDGYWTGPGLGQFNSPAAAMAWLERDLERQARHRSEPFKFSLSFAY